MIKPRMHPSIHRPINGRTGGSAVDEDEGEGTACPHSRMACRYFPVVSTCDACAASGVKMCSGRSVELYSFLGGEGVVVSSMCVVK